MKLTISMRDSIEERETARRFQDKLNAAKAELALLVEEELKKHLQDIPQELIDNGWIRTSYSVNILNIKDGEAQGRKNYENINIHNSYPTKLNTHTHEVEATKKIKKAYESKHAISAEMSEFRQKIRQVLHAFQSSKQLVLNVPELESYFKDENSAKSMALIPVQEINDLRKMLKKGLKNEK